MLNLRPVMRATLWTFLLLGLVLGGKNYLDTQHQQEQQTLLTQTREQLIHEQFRFTRDAVERLFSLGYQTIRTISLLPSVRGIHGNNRLSEEENVVQEGRFSQEGAATVQQLYNNLAANASVSEVYGIVKGFQPNQFPFFMYDELILQKEQVHADGEKAVSLDAPEESEEAEYHYYPIQISHFDQVAPRFNFDNLDSVPAVSSPAMRTCDNTQYQSISHDDVHNTDGILYSVPFYSDAGDLRGIISAIFRVNILEALLLNVPFIPVTEDDKKLAIQRQFSLPEQLGHFVLVNASQQVFVGDRRNAKLIAAVKQAVADNKNKEQLFQQNLYQQTLDIKDSGQWQLYYEYDPMLLTNAVAPLQQQYKLKQWGLFAFLVIAFLWIMEDYIRRTHLLKAASQLQQIAAGKLQSRTEMKARSELGQLLKALHVMEKQLLQVVTTVRTGAQQLHQESIGIALRNQDLTQRTQDNAVGLEEITASVHALSDVVHNTAKNAAQVELLTITAYENSSSGLQEINSVVSAMQQIEQYSSRINSIVVLMEEISSTTNLLALNAELEAARAGQAGSGFAVVATEIRHLAARSAASMVEIKQLVGDTTEAITTGSHLVQQAGQALADIERTVRDVRTHILGIATSTRDQEFGIQEIMRVLDTLTEATAQNAVLVQQMACASEILDGQAAALKTETDYFTLVDE